VGVRAYFEVDAVAQGVGSLLAEKSREGQHSELRVGGEKMRHDRLVFFVEDGAGHIKESSLRCEKVRGAVEEGGLELGQVGEFIIRPAQALLGMTAQCSESTAWSVDEDPVPASIPGPPYFSHGAVPIQMSDLEVESPGTPNSLSELLKGLLANIHGQDRAFGCQASHREGFSPSSCTIIDDRGTRLGLYQFRNKLTSFILNLKESS